MTRAAAGLFAAALVGGCVALPHPTEADADRARRSWPSADVASLEAGRAAFVLKCSGCHALPLPGQHTPEQWPKVTRFMGHRGKLAPDDLELIERFLVVLAGRPPDAG